MTGKAIAEAVGIIKKNKVGKTVTYNGKNINEMKDEYCSAVVVAGGHLQNILDQELSEPQLVATFWNIVLNKPNVVFARTSPTQKLLIVSAVQGL